ncbi:MAG: J domain-containing protein [Putridiphycobacter sp.]|nr:J domain-containing protein [Putridiphycobacter sp.]
MNAKNIAYFKLLGIAPTTDKAAIKRAFRKKAFQYHPDRNKLPSAHEKFIKLSEAYEALTEPSRVKRAEGFSAQKTPEEVLAERIRAARERYQKAKKKEARDELAYFEMLTTGFKGALFKVFSIIALIVAVVWVLDYHVFTSEIVAIKVMPSNVYGKYVSYFIQGNEYSFDKSGLPGGYELVANARFSRVFNDLIDVEKVVLNNGVPSKMVVVPLFGFAQAYPFFVLFLVLPFITFKFRRSSIVFTVSYLFCASFVAFMLLFRLVSVFV